MLPLAMARDVEDAEKMGEVLPKKKQIPTAHEVHSQDLRETRPLEETAETGAGKPLSLLEVLEEAWARN